MVRLVGLIIKTPVIGQKCPFMGEGYKVSVKNARLLNKLPIVLHNKLVASHVAPLQHLLNHFPLNALDPNQKDSTLAQTIFMSSSHSILIATGNVTPVLIE